MKRLQCCLSVIAVLCIACTCAWMSRTCLVLDEAAPYPVFKTWYSNWCARGVLTAVCVHVLDVKLDMSGVPADIDILCLNVEDDMVLPPDSFVRFPRLRRIYILGNLTTVFPGAFRGLSNLVWLSMANPQGANATLASKALHGLHSLEVLILDNLALSKMAPDVFDGLNQLRRLYVSSPDEKFSQLLCRLVNVSMSLETLSVTMDRVESLEASNCSVELREFPALRNISLSFTNITKIQRDTLRYFKRISELSMPMNDLLQAQLLESGIQSVDNLMVKMTDAKFECVCKIADVFNVTELSIEMTSTSLERITLMSQQHSSFVNLSFIHALRNVKKLSMSLGGTFEMVDESLSSLCGGEDRPVGLTHFFYNLEGRLIITPRQFICLHHLEYLLINCRSTMRIDEFALEGLHKLQKIIIWPRFNLTFALSSFRGLDQVNFIILSSVKVKVIKSEHFKGLKNLLTLEMSPNLHHIEDFAFQELGKLKSLCLADNKISVITASTFSGLRELQTLVLEGNPLKHIEASAFSHLTSLQTLSLNFYTPPFYEHWNMQVLNLSLVFGMFPQQLSKLSITNGRSLTLVIADDSAPKVDLELHLEAEKLVLLGCERHFVKSVTYLNVRTNQFICGPDSTSALAHFTSLQELHFIYMSLSIVQDFSGLNRLMHLKRLDMENVNFFGLAHINVMFQNLTKLESLSLYNSWADSLEGSLTADLTSLKYLQLDILTENSVTEAFFEPFSNLKFMIIYQFKLRCNCENAWFDGWAKQQSRVEVFLFSSYQRTLQCRSGSRVEELEEFSQKYCSLDVGFVLFAGSASFLLVFMLAVLLQQLASDYLLAFYHIAQGWLDEVLRRNARRRYLYDAFVSYSGRDEPWVVEQLLPSLERRGPPFLRLCLHSRDFQLGKDVVENITDSLYRSRRTLCLISRNFLRSNWCSLELRLATYRLQVEHRDVLILVFLEEIPSRLLSAHHRLARLVKTRTYINWPQDPAQHEAFWDRLWAKLAPLEE